MIFFIEVVFSEISLCKSVIQAFSSNLISIFKEGIHVEQAFKISHAMISYY